MKIIVILSFLMASTVIQAEQSATDMAADFYESAMGYYEEKDYGSAIIQLQNVLNREPANLSGRILLGKARLKAGDAKSAEKELLLAEEMGADKSLIVLALADAYLEQGKLDDLLAHFNPEHFDVKLAAQIHARFGEAYLRKKDLVKAQQHYKKTLLIKPNHAKATAGETMIMVEKGQLKQAEQKLDNALKKNVDSAELWLVKGIIATKQGRLVEAEKNYSKVLEIEPKHLKARGLHSMVLLDLNKYAEAVKDLEQLSVQYSWDPRVFYMLAIAKYESGDEEGARSAMQKTSEVLDIASSSAQLHDSNETKMLIAVVASINGEHERAVEAFRKYFSKNVGNISTLKLYASSLIHIGKAKEAINILKKAQFKNNNDMNVLYLLGEAYQKTSQRQKALKIYQQVLARFPAHPMVSLRYAGLRMVEGKSAEAITQLLKAQKLAPNNGAINRVLALAYMETGQEEKGLQLIERLLRKNPNNIDLANIRATAFLRMKQYNKAKKALKTILQKDPSFIQANLNLAEAEQASGNLEAASDIYWGILQKNPKHTRTMYKLAQLEIKQGNLISAEDLLKKALREDPRLILVSTKLIEVYLIQHKTEKALDLALSIKANFKHNIMALIALTKVFIAKKDKNAAFSTLKKATNLVKRDANYQVQLAQFYLQLNAPKKAHQLLEQAYKNNEENTEVLSLITLLDLKTNQLMAAKLRIKKALIKNKSALNYQLLGDIQMVLKSYNKAIESYSIALEKQPLEKNVYKLYIAYKHLGKTNQAFELLDKFSKQWTKARLIGLLYAEALAGKGEIDRAIIQYQLLLVHFPNDIMALNNLADLQIQQNDPEALETAQAAYELAPKNAAVLDTYGWAQYVVGEKTKALKYLRDAVSRAGNIAGIQYHLGIVLDSLNKKNQAIMHLRKAVRLNLNKTEKKAALQLLKKLGAV